MREIRIEPTLDSWRRAARLAIAKGLRPEEIRWRESREPTPDPGLFDPPPTPPSDAAASNEAADLRVPRAFLALAESVIASADADRWRLLYSVLWRIAAGDRDLLLRRGDPELQRLREIAAAQPADRAEGSSDPDGAASFVPPDSDLSQLAKAAASCRGCDLYRHATQTVFGKGPATAKVVLVGEAPGDQEDLRGAPFVGPAGEVLDRALQAAGLSRDSSTSRTRSSTSSSSARRSAASTRPRARRRSRRAAPGSRRSSRCCLRESWYASEPPQPRRFSAPTSG